MLIWLRENKRRVAHWFVYPLILTFILLYGYSGVQNQRALDERTAVKVNGNPVSMARFQAIDREVSRFYTNTLVEPEKPRTLVALEQTIERELARQLAADLGLRADDSRVNQLISTQMGDGSGVVNERAYRGFLEQTGFQSHENYKEFLRSQMNVELALDAVRSTALPGKEDLDRAVRSQQETRMVEMLMFPSSRYLSEVDATTEEVKAYFEQHKDRYRFPKRMAIDYLESKPADFVAAATPEGDNMERWFRSNREQFLVPAERTVQAAVFSAASFRDQVEVSDQALQAYYDAKKTQYTEAEKFRAKFVMVSVEVPDASIEAVMNQRPDEFKADQEAVAARHILVKTESGAGPDQLAAAKTKLDEIRSRISTEEDFIREAKAHSEDDSNKFKGGDLGYFSKGRMVPEFEAAVFSLPEATVSQPIKSMFGYHLIWVYGHRGTGDPISVEEARFRVLREIDTQPIRQKAREKLSGVKEMLAGRSLTDASVSLDLPVYETEWFSRGDNPHEMAVKDKFPFYQATSVLSPGLQSEIVEGFAGFYLIELVAKQESRQQTFEEVRSQVDKAYRTEKAGELARVKAQEAADLIRSGSLTFEALAKVYGLPEPATYANLRSPGSDPLPQNRAVDREIVNRAFTLEANAVEGPFDTLQGPTLLKLVAEIPEHLPELSEVIDRVDLAYRDIIARDKARESAWEVWTTLDQHEDSLKKSALAKSLEVKTTEPFRVGGNAPGFPNDSVVSFVAASLRVVGATSPVLEDPPQTQENPQPVRAFYLIQAAMIEEPRMPAFEEVAEEVRQDLLLEKAASLAQEKAGQAAQQIAQLLAQATGPISATKSLDLKALATKNAYSFNGPVNIGFGVNSPVIEGQNSSAAISATVYQLPLGAVSQPVAAIEAIPEGTRVYEKVHGYYILEPVGVQKPPSGGASRGEVFRTIASRLQDAAQTDWAERSRMEAEIAPNQEAFSESILEELNKDLRKG